MQGRIVNMGLNLMTFAVDKEEQQWSQRMQEERLWDNMSGKQLRTGEVRKARQEEMEDVYKHGVYVKVPISECRKVTGKEPIGTRWVDVNKRRRQQQELQIQTRRARVKVPQHHRGGHVCRNASLGGEESIV